MFTSQQPELIVFSIYHTQYANNYLDSRIAVATECNIFFSGYNFNCFIFLLFIFNNGRAIGYVSKNIYGQNCFSVGNRDSLNRVASLVKDAVYIWLKLLRGFSLLSISEYT